MAGLSYKYFRILHNTHCMGGVRGVALFDTLPYVVTLAYVCVVEIYNTTKSYEYRQNGFHTYVRKPLKPGIKGSYFNSSNARLFVPCIHCTGNFCSLGWLLSW